MVKVIRTTSSNVDIDIKTESSNANISITSDPNDSQVSIEQPSYDYNRLSNKPEINSTVLTGNHNGAHYGLVDAEEGKGLSTNDYTDEDKNKLAGIEPGAEVNVQSDWNETDTTKDSFIQNKPTKVSAFENDKQYQTLTEVNTSISTHNTSTESHSDIRGLVNEKQPLLTSENAGDGIEITGSGSSVKITNTRTSAEWGNIIGTLSDQTDLQQALDSKVDENKAITAGTHTKITYDSKGLVTGGSDLQTSDIPSIPLSKISDVTATANEVNVLDGITATTTELNYVDGVTSNIQTQLNNKVEKNNDITGATHTKITYDSKGLVTGGSDLSASDIPNLTLSKITDVTATASEVNVLDGITATTTELNYVDGVTSSIQTQINSKVNTVDIINNTSTSSTDKPLSANMGKSLQDQVDNLKARGRFLALWNSETGLAMTEPSVNPYTYKTGDYFIIGKIATSPNKNYKPSGSTYDKTVPSRVEETEVINTDDVYYYDGTNWALQINTRKEVTFENITGSPYDNTELSSALNDKVTGNNSITAGTHTKITYDSKGLVTSGTDLSASDIPNLTLTKISDVTATAAELNVLDGITATTTELNYVDGVTSNIQTQLNNKAIPDDIKNGVLTIQRNGVNVKTFSANQSNNETANIEVPTAAADISYTNPDYPTVGAALDKLLYVKPSVSISGGNNYEIGQTINTVNLSWTWNKNITSQSLNQGIGSLATNVRSYAYTTPITSNKTFTISGGDGTNTASASTSVTFYYKRYWGVSANTTLTDAEILALSQELSGSRAQTRTFNCSGGKYFYFVILASYCTGIAFKVGGLSFSDLNVVTRNVVNAQGYTASYNIYRPNNIQTGASIPVEVS